jgi:hypothetical protein
MTPQNAQKPPYTPPKPTFPPHPPKPSPPGLPGPPWGVHPPDPPDPIRRESPAAGRLAQRVPRFAGDLTRARSEAAAPAEGVGRERGGRLAPPGSGWRQRDGTEGGSLKC